MTNAKKRSFRVLSVIMVLVAVVTCFSTTASAAGAETLNKGKTSIGEFNFTDKNTTPPKTIKGTKVTFEFLWRMADGYCGNGKSEDRDQNQAYPPKLTLQILDYDTGKALTGKVVFHASSDTWYSPARISTKVPYGKRVKVWFDASSEPGESNGAFRSIHIHQFIGVVS